jgi:ATP-dependent Zn protease
MSGATEGEKRLYDLLVEGPEDFLGIIAYSVYKQQKSEIISRLSHDSEKLKVELEAFYRLSKTDSQKNFYKNQALELSRTFLTSAVGEFLDERTAEIQAEEQRKFDAYKPSFWASVWAGVVAGIISILFLGLVIFFINSARYGFTTAVEKGFGVKITQVKEETPPSPTGENPKPAVAPAPAK